ncbi:ATP-binding protein [Pseudomonas vancouverensis]|uniref:sensor histidine kinase n=1 Tax=Pseudomonas vancouverensis TaxID=95300 RepID=UPI003D063A4D
MPEIIARKYFVDLLFRQSYAVLFANFVIPWPVAFVFRHAVPWSWSAVWILAMYGLTTCRVLHSRRYFAQAKRDVSLRPQHWGWLAAVLSWLSSLLWGVLGWIGFATGDPQLQAFTCVVLTGLVCGAVPSLSAFPAAYAGSLVAMLAPITLQCLLTSGEVYTTYLFFLACLAGVNLYYSRVTWRTLHETIRLRLENVDLVRRLEQERDRAQAADQAKSRFLAAASHDLRQPIHALGLFVAGLASLAERGAVAADKARELATRLATVIGNLSGLLNGLLDISRLDAGVVAVTRETVSVERLFADLSDEFSANARARNLRWRVRPGQFWIDTDPVLLKRMLDNLLSNAIRYTEQGSVMLGCRRRRHSLEIQIFDTGPGIASEHRDQIFEEFVQLHNAERDRSQGLGLGLAIVRHTARLLGHDIRVTSVEGRGSMFSVKVPLVAAPAQAQPHTVAAAQADSLGILIIDDERTVLDALRQLLEVWGHRVYAGASVREACDEHGKAAENGPAAVHLILSDFRLSGMNGLEAIHRARGYLNAVVPAIIITGDTSSACLEETAASHFRVLQKPLDAGLLRDSLKACLESRRVG